MNYIFNISERVDDSILIKGASYRIIFAQKCLTPQGVQLILKIRAHPRNILVKMPEYAVGVLEMGQIDKINKEKHFVNFSYWGRQPSGNPVIQLRNAKVAMPTYSEMAAAGAIGKWCH